MAILTGAMPMGAHAACSATAPGSGTTVTCSGASAPSVVAAAGSTNVTINLDSTATGSYVLTSTPTPFSVDTSSAITNNGNLSMSGNGTGVANRGAVLLGVNNGNTLTNTATGVISTTGTYNDGMAANGNNNTLVNNGTITTTGNNSYGMTAAWGQSNPGASGNRIVNTGTVTTSGNNARAASLLGGNGTITNSGTLTSNGRDAPAVYMQGNNDTLVNSGTIQTTGTATSGGSVDAVVSNTLGSSFTATITNQAGGRIISNNGIGVRSTNGATTITNAGLIQGGGGTAIQGGSGNVTLILQTGSQIVGTANGGGGTNTVTLQGTGTASNAFTNFQSLTMAGTDWTWAGTGAFSTALVQSGTLNLTGTLGTTTASVVATVNAGATLQANASNLPLSVTDNGLVRFQQDSAGTYTGTIGGSGAVEKTGAGMLTVAPTAAGGNTYSGGTMITQGTLSIAADNALGASAGSLTFNGGTLQLGSAFNVAAGRAASITSNNGTIDTQGFNSTLTQGITGAGSLTKLGSGTLTLNGANSYAGGTNVNAGTVIVGDGTSASAALSGGGPVSVASGATLGGYGSVTGNVTNNGTISVANALASLAGGATGNFQISGNLTNAGLVQLGGSGVGNTLTVVGNYVGQNATIALNTTLAGDGAPSDKLIVSGGAASGASTLKVTNVGGAGAQTVADGIQVVQATNGGTTSAGAFSLSGGTVSAGAYSYFLAKGGAANGTGESWYLRNTVPPKPVPPVVQPGQPTPPPQSPITPAEGTPESIVEAVDNAGTGGASEPVYRPEVPLYAEAPAVARQLGLLQIDTFHDRQGEQGLLSENGPMPASWARVWGGNSNIKQKGDVTPSFDGTVWGMQVGQDLYADTSPSGHRNHYGFFLGFARAVGDVNGFALAQQDLGVGTLQVNAYNLGGYWTHIGPGGWYTDAVLMGSALTVRTHSNDNVNGSTNGNAFTGSVEAGFPVALGNGLTLEPQAQLVWQWLSLDHLNDGVSSVMWNNGNTFLGRLGARLQWAFDANGVSWKPYLRVNVLRSFGADDKTTFGGTTTIGTQVGQTAGQIGAGLVAQLTKRGSVYATLSYLTNLGGEHQRTITGNAGVRWAW
ncbi:autotransporter outer membrane beta-barrel domain-containing protein [Burkholderia sp. HI2761]|uniref:autotransporter outer membrane beta-barrel domain-containing protein n=1 Tax=unclassified Burkholderia TaxID=2613784 RepID=UPI000B7AB74A|nr:MULTISPECIES: autotransporter outer membrane beta-barrel domain-containing protein [unclassified Burkholderia]MPV57764.1 autotransporter outer membrane beta-barrel domain-containing protein [Burkholderia sp. BE24]OXJ23232.1 autotransporter outer membrane beta-barrel domain-containing protein [Burkholderia sp. HI2761]